MAEQFIEDLYWYADIVFELEAIVEDIRLCLDNKIIDKLDGVFPDLCELCRKYILLDQKKGMELWNEVKDITQINNDIISVGDKIDLAILPKVREFISLLGNIDVETDNRYSIQSTASGYLTLYDMQNGLYLHSKNDPMYEALLYVRSIYDYTKQVYYVYGCGLGYAIYQLYVMSDGLISIILFEPEDTVYESAINYGVLSRIPQDIISRKHFKDTDSFIKEADLTDAAIMLHIPSVNAIVVKEERLKLQTRWMWINTDRIFEAELRMNRFRNNQLGYGDAQSYIQSLKCKEAVVVAAGPSLNTQLDLLRGFVGKKTIFAVAHALKKLLAEGIQPDCVVMIDCQKNMLRQIPEEKCVIPLLLDESAYWKVARLYKGPIYFMRSWEYDGTVASAALEAAIRSGASDISLIGLDLGYPVLKSHAEGIDGAADLDTSSLFPVESTNGEPVMTDRHLNYYRHIIERQIAAHKDIRFRNLSKNGAKIKGTI